ncbi:MAG: tetratricopeptide repeat protein [Candidatus Accumulibacter sp.]|jgi:tetratricopeptide (TPR) repeat protein|nr:tetratricopeptide repeat protein [Accumulibacter sp.]
MFWKFFGRFSALFLFIGFSALAMNLAFADAVTGEAFEASEASEASEPSVSDTPATDTPDASAKKPGLLPNDGLDSVSVYQLLLAEVALQRGDLATASAEYADLALRTRDAAVMERSIIVSGLAKRFTAAREIAELWLDVDPRSERAQDLLARLKIHSRELDGLAPALIRMFRQNGESLPDNFLSLNRMFADNPDRPAVLQVIEEVCEAFPDLAEAHYAVALAAESAGRFDFALAEARRAQELKPEWDRPALFQAQFLSRRVSKDDAIEFLKGYVGDHPDVRNPRLFLARLLLGNERYADARVHFEHLAKLHPDDPEIIYPLGLLGVQQDDMPMAEARLKHFLTLTRGNKSTAYFYLGSIAEKGNRIDEAISYYANVTRGSSYLPAQFRRVRLMVARGQITEARRILSGIQTRTDEELVQVGLVEADFLRKAGEHQAAFDLLEGLFAKRADNLELLYQTALLAEKLGRMDLLETRLRRLIELRPNSAQAYNALGYSFADRNIRLSEARELIETALKLSDEGPILDSMGWVLFRQGEFSSALSYLERAQKDHDDPEIVAHIGEVLWALGRGDEARRLLLDARRRFPDSEVLQAAIERILH